MGIGGGWKVGSVREKDGKREGGCERGESREGKEREEECRIKVK